MCVLQYFLFVSKRKTRKTATHAPPNTLANVHAVPSEIASSPSMLLKWICTDTKVATIAMSPAMYEMT